MPSPVAHALAGLVVHTAVSRAPFELWDARRAALTVGAALAPDLDLLLRLVDGRNHHQAESHSVGAACLAALVAGVVARVLRAEAPARLARVVGLAWLSHLLLDWLSRDTNPPIGLLALWPFSHAWWKCPWPLFLDIGRTLEWATLRHNVVAAAWECVLVLPLLLLVARARFRARE
jgi:membrane-bound metal-dependent hydrolase YbcI (DUF457 family)